MDFTGSEEAVIGKVRELIRLFPSNIEDEASVESSDELNRDTPVAAASIADPAALAAEAADDGKFLELKAAYAMDMVTGFASFGGTTAGIVANRETGTGTALTADCCNKAADFVRYCDAFGIPVVTFTNVSGFAATMGDENKVGLAAARLTGAFAGATVPKINVITGKVIGSAYAVMNAKGTGADFTLAFPGTVIGIMDATNAAHVIAPDAEKAELDRIRKEYAAMQGSVESAAARGLVDQVVEPSDLRRSLIGALEVLYTKRIMLPARKHSSR